MSTDDRLGRCIFFKISETTIFCEKKCPSKMTQKSVGKTQQATPPVTETATWPSAGIEERLAVSGVDLTLIDIEEGEEYTTIRPKKFLGDLWGPINEAIRTLGGGWIREGRDSRWEIRKGDLE